MAVVRAWLQGTFNAAHVYCRLMDMGLPKNLARRCAKVWGFCFHHFLYA